jgi:glycosyltransferase involved in cell wall biosynthesis
MEVLVIDDGSRDDTEALVRNRYAGCRYVHQRNRGVSHARNRGIRLARGDWLAFLDSDDAWLPGKLAAQVHALQQVPGMQICHTDEIWIRNGRRVNPMHKHRKSGGHIFRRCLPRCVISPSSVVIQRSLFDQVGLFDESLPACEDYDLWLRICARHPVVFLEQPLILKFGGHEDQLSRRHWGMDRFRIQALEKILATPALAEPDRLAALHTLIEKARILAQGAYKRGHLQRAEAYRRKQRHYRTLLRDDRGPG